MQKKFLKNIIKQSFPIVISISFCCGISPRVQIPPWLGNGSWGTYYYFFHFLPYRFCSRMMGWLSKLEIPSFFRNSFFNTFIAYYNINPTEFESDLDSFNTFHSFLIRKLSHQREISNTKLVSPCDSIITSFGCVRKGKIQQIKGLDFTLTGFLGKKPILKKKQSELYYIVFYLPLQSYHCFHSPANISFQNVRHFPGHLFKMSPFHFYSIQALPSINERIVFFGTYTGNKKDEQFIAFVSIGSLGLGSIKIYHDPKIQTNRDSQDQDAKIFGYLNFNSLHENFLKNRMYDNVQFKRDYSWEYLQPIKLIKGQEFGHFELGSTIVIIFEAKKGVKFCIKKGQNVKYGQAF